MKFYVGDQVVYGGYKAKVLDIAVDITPRIYIESEHDGCHAWVSEKDLKPVEIETEAVVKGCQAKAHVKAKTTLFESMREATVEERACVDNFIRSISTPVNYVVLDLNALKKEIELKSYSKQCFGDYYDENDRCIDLEDLFLILDQYIKSTKK